MPCTDNDNNSDSDEADGFLCALHTNRSSMVVSMFLIIFTETFLVTCFLSPELAFLPTMSSPTNEPQQTVLGHGHCAKNTTRLIESIMAELEGSQDVPATKSKPRRSKKLKTNQNHFNGLTVEGDLDDKGSDYTSRSSSQSDTTDDESEIMNEEVS